MQKSAFDFENPEFDMEKSEFEVKNLYAKGYRNIRVI